MDNHSRLNRIYRAMKTRCYNANAKSYKWYGARGITICEEWQDYSEFKNWAHSNGYESDLTIDRIDGDKGYSPENCRWVSMKVQSNNRRSNHRVTYGNEVKSLAEWCEKKGMSYKRVEARIKKLGWTVERALETKDAARARLTTYKGRTQNLSAWQRELGFNYRKVLRRLNLGWPVERAFETE